MDPVENTPVELGAAPPAQPQALSDEALARKLYEEEIAAEGKMEGDERLARELQAREDRSTAKRLLASESTEEAEEPAQQKPDEPNPFWTWFGGVKQKSVEMLGAAKKNLQEFGTVVEQKGSTLAQTIKKEGSSFVTEAKSGIDELLESEMVKNAKKEMSEIGDKVSNKTKEIISQARTIWYDQAVFGVPLVVAAGGRAIPVVVEDCIARIEALLAAEAGSVERPNVHALFTFDAPLGVVVRKLRDLYQEGETVDLSKFDAYTLSGLLLTFFKELPEPLIQFNLDPILSEPDSLKRIELLREAFKTQSGILYSTTRRLTLFLSKVHTAAAQVQNQPALDVVTLSNLFGPAYHRNSEQIPVKDIIRAIILNAAAIFPSNYEPAAAAAQPTAAGGGQTDDLLILSDGTEQTLPATAQTIEITPTIDDLYI